MKIIEKGAAPERQYRCTGKGNSGHGCGALLGVLESDVFQTSKSDYLGDTEYFATFQCPLCGVFTDIPSYPEAINLPRHTEWQKAKRELTFAHTTGSALKVQALTDALATFNGIATTITVKGESGVNEQPVGFHEILRGATNRAVSAYTLTPLASRKVNVYIGIENGIDATDTNGKYWLDYAIAVAFIPASETIIYTRSKAVQFPTEMVYLTQNKPGGFEKNTVGKTLQERGIVRSHDDPHLDLTGVSRRVLLNWLLSDLINKLPASIPQATAELITIQPSTK